MTTLETPMLITHEIQEVKVSVMRMISLIREQGELAGKVLVHHDLDAMHRCIALDKTLIDASSDLELNVLRYLAHFQPETTHLRFLGAIHRMIVDIERASEYAVRTVHLGAELCTTCHFTRPTDLPKILEVLTNMVEMTIHAIAEHNLDKAYFAYQMDQEIDDLYAQAQRELLILMMEDPNTIGIGTKLLTVTRNLERFGDHIENINKHTFFWITGQRTYPGNVSHY